ncbi:hypothetical protein BFP97_05610 [Roseivirga sp. 4D4]|uniref:hypothetical protein n=1 Tax=Roseivirga sp. 4D4 TaxID=1889784 RepID=UPI000853E926|nr:hypothetical protein [Roseivirga sp. 4D4]OEK01017.1 hypothetical protein BFP97_05610 [Roseivirga sp. 4D4]
MYWVIYIPLLVVVIVVIWVLVKPIVIICDSHSNTYQVFQKGTFSFSVLTGELITTELRILGRRVRTDSNEKKKRKKSKKKDGKRKVRHPIKLFKRCMRAFKVKKLLIDVDTGDVVLNAKLVPIGYFLTNAERHRSVHFNFEGITTLKLEAHIRLHVILIALIQQLFKR